MSIVNRTSILRVIALEINEDGAVSKKQMKIDRDSQLENTLLQADYPDIRVATIDIPQQQLDQYQQAMVEHSLSKRIAYDGVEYILVGASASAKNGKYYAVDAAHAKTIAQRFRFWPEAAMTYFGILVSPCKVCIEIPDARVVVVRDHELGTNDCRGWIRRSYFERLHLTDRHFYQFRMSFENTQAKGSFKIMEDDVADALSVDFIIPRSSCKPEFKKPECVRQCPTAAGRMNGQYSTGRVVIGIREVSRELQFSSSYTLVEHAPLNSIETEIKPIAMAAVEKLKTAIASNDFTELFRILGMSEEVELLRADETVADPEHTSSEHTVVEAVLKADSTGYWVKHPFVNSHLQRTLARWAFKLCTAGGFTLPAFALADDGYLVLHDGRIYSGSDWIPEWYAVNRQRRASPGKFTCQTVCDAPAAHKASAAIAEVVWTDPYSGLHGPKDTLCSAYAQCPVCPLGSIDFQSPYACAQAHNLLEAVRRAAETMEPQAWIKRMAPVQQKLLNAWLCEFSEPVRKAAEKLSLPPLPAPE